MRFFTKSIFLSVLFFSVFLLNDLPGFAQAADCPSCWVPIVKQRLVPNINVSPNIKGLVEFLPANYNNNTTTKYPLIINLHGRGAWGDGSQFYLCQVACEGIGIALETDRFSTSVVNNGTTYSYIVLSPNLSASASPDDISTFISYAFANYRVDRTRVYLTGLSSGGSLVMNFMSSSPQNAKKIAALIPISPCIGSNDAGASNIGSQQIHFWGLHGSQDAQCVTSNMVSWNNRINNFSPQGNPMAKYTLIPPPQSDPVFPYHVIWPFVHYSDFRVDGKNMSEWFIQYSNSAAGALPATLSKYEVLSKGAEVVTNWSTSAESNTAHFLVERAGPDMQFKVIGKVTAAGDASVTKNYSFSDKAPLKGTSYYRLSLMNKDGLQEYYEIKKIVGKQFGGSISLSPVPASKAIQLSIELESAQKIQFMIRDINGRTVETWAASFSAGFANIPLNIEKLSSGMYYLSIQGSNFTESKKFIKQ